MSFERKDQMTSDAPKFHRKNIFQNDVYSVSNTNNYNPLTCQIMGTYQTNIYPNPYETTNNKNYGKPSTNKYDGKVFEKNIEMNYNNKCAKKQEDSIFGDNLNDNNKLVGKKQYDRSKGDFNLINGEGNDIFGSKEAGKKQFNRFKAEINVINPQLNEETSLKDVGKKMYYEKGKNDFNLISGQRNDEGRYTSAKQEFQIDKKGEETLKKRLYENSNLVNQFAGFLIK